MVGACRKPTPARSPGRCRGRSRRSARTGAAGHPSGRRPRRPARARCCRTPGEALVFPAVPRPHRSTGCKPWSCKSPEGGRPLPRCGDGRCRRATTSTRTSSAVSTGHELRAARGSGSARGSGGAGAMACRTGPTPPSGRTATAGFRSAGPAQRTGCGGPVPYSSPLFRPSARRPRRRPRATPSPCWCDWPSASAHTAIPRGRTPGWTVGSPSRRSARSQAPRPRSPGHRFPFAP